MNRLKLIEKCANDYYLNKLNEDEENKVSGFSSVDDLLTAIDNEDIIEGIIEIPEEGLK